MAIERFLISRVTRNCAPRTFKWYRIILDKYAEVFPDVPDNIDRIEEFIRDAKGNDERRHGYYRALRAFHRFLKNRYDIPNPIEKLEAPRRKKKLPKGLSLESFIRLMHYDHPPDIQAFLQFLADTGCRVGELDNLKPEDIEHSAEGYIVRLDGKTGERYVPIIDKTYRDILPYIPVRYKVDWLTRRIAQAFRDAGVKGTAHTLRHTFCSLWDGNEFALQQITGHTNMNTLGIYRHLRMKQIAKQHNKYTLMNFL